MIRITGTGTRVAVAANTGFRQDIMLFRSADLADELSCCSMPCSMSCRPPTVPQL